MQCNSPIRLSEGDAKGTFVPCGKCIPCLQTRRNDWSTRLQLELEDASDAHFLTLTYHDDYIPYTEEGLPSLDKEDIKLFFKRLRYKCKGFKYFLVGEYGGKYYRPHYHFIIFNTGLSQDDCLNTISQAWCLPYSFQPIGMVHIGTATVASIHYTTKYMLDKAVTRYEDEYNVIPSFTMCSKGIGKSYIEKNWDFHKADYKRQYIPMRGNIKARMPRYIKDKIYTTGEKEAFGHFIINKQDEKDRKDNFRDYRIRPAKAVRHDEITKKRHLINSKNKL